MGKTQEKPPSLPQCSSTPVKWVVAKLRYVHAGQPIAPWLEIPPLAEPEEVKRMFRVLAIHEQQLEFSPGVIAQVRGLLKFLKISDRLCLNGAVADSPDHDSFWERLQNSVVTSYSEAGCGTRGDLQWLGKEPISKTSFNRRVDGTSRFTASGRKKKTGLMNAYYCLRALHETLLKLKIGDPGESGRDNPASKLSPVGADVHTALEPNDFGSTRTAEPRPSAEFARAATARADDAKPQVAAGCARPATLGRDLPLPDCTYQLGRFRLERTATLGDAWVYASVSVDTTASWEGLFRELDPRRRAAWCEKLAAILLDEADAIRSQVGEERSRTK
jgi:hypothetical protein